MHTPPHRPSTPRPTVHPHPAPPSIHTQPRGPHPAARLPLLGSGRVRRGLLDVRPGLKHLTDERERQRLEIERPGDGAPPFGIDLDAGIAYPQTKPARKPETKPARTPNPPVTPEA
ncbi:DUF6191 domain-containing protein [Georgenia yuyongxinii]|uniref:DUF6191 domain-containing protein n=1 Tax=Georgenia yuyongxinii TaxID=2589797 RepID=UPI00363DEB0D